MATNIEFTRNHQDLSTENGFQFEFACNRCGNGFRSRFKQFIAGTVTGLLKTAGSIFGGILGQAASIGDNVKSAAWESSHDKAFEEAAREIKPEFIQCPRCSNWVCRKACWNPKHSLCKECAPDLGAESAAAQASRSTEEVWAHAKMADEDKGLDWSDPKRATCPKCSAPLKPKAKFCPECGEKLAQKAHCSNCGARIDEGAKFCPECGTKK